MLELLITSSQSGGGKTIVTCAFLDALKKKGLRPCAFKCGPDYIDPMFHRSVLGLKSANLDLYLSDAGYLRAFYQEASYGQDACVIEGVMGYYDGLMGTSAAASSYDVARTLGVPALLVIPAKGSSLTLAAVIRGIADFRADANIRGVILNQCSAGLFASMKETLSEASGIPILGYLPVMEEAKIKSRHLGLYTASEISDLSARIGAVSDMLLETIDWDLLLQLYDRCLDRKPVVSGTETAKDAKKATAVIAVAKDEAFCFCYDETLSAFEKSGARIITFSPLHDAQIPKADGLYLPGGYPELHLEKLSRNETMRESIHDAVVSGLPTIAECGGFLYLSSYMCDDNMKLYEMCRVLPGVSVYTNRLIRFGYAQMTAKTDSMLFRSGETIPVHEFHYWDCDRNGNAMTMKKENGKTWESGFVTDTLYAGFPHLYFAGHRNLEKRFVDCASKGGSRCIS